MCVLCNYYVDRRLLVLPKHQKTGIGPVIRIGCDNFTLCDEYFYCVRGDVSLEHALKCMARITNILAR